MAMAAVEPSPAAVMTWARGFAALPATQTPGTLVRPVASVTIHPLSSIAQPRSLQGVVVGHHPWPHKDSSPTDDAPVGELDTGESVVFDEQPGNRAVDDPDGTGDQRLAVCLGQVSLVGEEHDIGGPLPDEVCVSDRLRGAADDAQRPVTDLVAMAVGAVEKVATPALVHARDVGEHVAKPGGHQQPARADHVAIGQLDVEAGGILAGGVEVGDPSGDDVGRVSGDLFAGQPQELGRREAVAGEEAVHVLGGRVAGFAGVDDRNAASGPGQDQRR